MNVPPVVARLGLALVVILALGFGARLRGRAADKAPVYDLVFREARVVDGTGGPSYVASVAVEGGRIATVGAVDAAEARRLVDAAGLVVAPGFVDVHTHAEEGLRLRPGAENLLLDGVTTIVTGNCGTSELDLGAFFRELRASGTSVNVASLVGHNRLREQVMGTVARDPTPEELARMVSLVEAAMGDGALGLSTGLVYVPGTYAQTPELVALARAAGRHGGLYASHVRDEGALVVEAVEEALQVGRDTGVRVEISHLKVTSKRRFGESARTLDLIAQAREQGLDVAVDQYPYTASSTSLGVLLPSWALAGPPGELSRRLRRPSVRRRIAAEMQRTIQDRDGRNRLEYAVVARCSWDESLEGLSVSEIHSTWGRRGGLEREIQTVLDMMAKGGAQMVYHSMDEGDLERIAQSPFTMFASDAGVLEPDRGRPHPRAYGTHARVLRRYVRERRLVTLEEAVRRMTSLPAGHFGLDGRGRLAPGLSADLVVFDPAEVVDRATFERPHAHPDGIRFVVVNGEVAAEDGRPTGARPGTILLGPGVNRAAR